MKGEIMKTKKCLILAFVLAVNLCIIGLVELFASEQASQEPAEKTEGAKSVTGLNEVIVQVGLQSQPLFEAEALTETRIEREIGLMLEDVGIKTTPKPASKPPVLRIKASVIFSSEGIAEPPHWYLVEVDFQLTDLVTPLRNPKIACLATTWRRTRRFILGRRAIEETLREYEAGSEELRQRLESASPEEFLALLALRELGIPSPLTAEKLKELYSQAQTAFYEDVRKPIRRVANEFINDYLAANPKEQPTAKETKGDKSETAVSEQEKPAETRIQGKCIVSKKALADLYICSYLHKYAIDPDQTEGQKTKIREMADLLSTFQLVYLESLGLGYEEILARHESLLKQLARGEQITFADFDYLAEMQETLEKKSKTGGSEE